MSEYIEGVGQGSAVIGTPELLIRCDTPGVANLSSTVTNLTTVRAQCDSAGNMRDTQEGGKTTYYACSQFACDSTATDIWTLAGNATTVVKVLFLLITSTANAAATGRLQVLRRSAANTGGTTASPTVAKADSRNAASSSTPAHYTAHPTALGTSAGAIASQQFGQQVNTAVPIQQPFVLDFRTYMGGQTLRLNGTSEILAVNAAAALGGTGNAWDIQVCWTEEALTA